MVWGIVKGWLDERTRAKVQILSGDGRSELIEALGEECVRNLPKELGGECECMAAEDVPQHSMGCMLSAASSSNTCEHQWRAISTGCGGHAQQRDTNNRGATPEGKNINSSICGMKAKLCHNSREASMQGRV
jgi:hypothetical protein